MSDREHTIHPEELEDFVRETLADDLLYVMGDDEGAAGLCPHITFYMRHAAERPTPLVQDMIALCRAFAALATPFFRLVREDDGRGWRTCRGGRLPARMDAAARRATRQGRSYLLEATDKALGCDSARWAIALHVDRDPSRFSYLKLTFRQHWYLRNRETWHGFVREAIARLQPEQCYSGFEIGNGGFALPLPRWHRMLERACATRLLGMDIDHPARMAEHGLRHSDGSIHPVGLGSGLRPPTWCFLLSPHWLDRLDRRPQEVAAALAHPEIAIDTIPYASGGDTSGQVALWIRLGQLDAYPADGPPPLLPGLAARLLRPLLLSGPELFLSKAGGSLNATEATRWLHRFDTYGEG